METSTSLEREYALKTGNGKHKAASMALNIMYDDSFSYLGKPSIYHTVFREHRFNKNEYTSAFDIHRESGEISTIRIYMYLKPI